MTDQTDIIDQIKARNQIQDVINDDGYKVPHRHGRYLKAPGHGGLVINTSMQRYWWNSQAEHGDVIEWVMHRQRMDFIGAVEWLAQRAGMPTPQWNPADVAAREVRREREEVLAVAHDVFMSWFWKNPTPRMYALMRGWTEDGGTDEDGDIIPGTMRLAMLGYTGDGLKPEREELEGQLVARAHVDLLHPSPIAVAILGMQGADRMKKWAAEHQDVELHEDWIEKGYIPGLAWKGRLVYPHIRNGRIVYLSTRSIEGKSHYNLPECLAGSKQRYINHVYAPAAEEVVIVEGQADAISLAQLGIEAVALAGVSATDDLADALKGHGAIYVALDADKAGKNGSWEIADAIGPMARIVNWSGTKYETYPDPAGGDPHQVKDANDLLRSMIVAGATPEMQAADVQAMMKMADTYAEQICTWAGELEGADRDAAVRRALRVVARMDEMDQAAYQPTIAKDLKITQRDLVRLIKTTRDANKHHGDDRELTYIFGGHIGNLLVEYFYDPEDMDSSLCWVDITEPDHRVVHTGDDVEIDRTLYGAMPAGDALKRGMVQLPSRVGELKATRELVAYIEAFISSVYLLPRRVDAKIMSYYVLLSWLYDSFNTIPYLRAMGDAGAGKSELMRRIGLITYRTMSTSGASSASSLFRGVEMFRGTAFIDEMDLSQSDAAQDAIKFMNLGAMKGNVIWRTEEALDENGRRVFELRGFDPFCPKLIAMRKDFKDDAVGSRCLTFKIQPRETIELVEAGVPLEINADMRTRAMAIRNLLLRWRLEHWQPEIPVDSRFYDYNISSRLNQVTGPLLAVAQDDPALQDEIRMFLREYYAETILTRSMTIAARIIEAIWKIHLYEDLKWMRSIDEQGNERILIGHVTKIADELINMMNASAEGEDDLDKPANDRNKLHPQRVGRLIREELQLNVSERTKLGFHVYWDEKRMKGLAKRYGVHPEEIITAISSKPTAQEKPMATQPELPVSEDED